MAKGSVQRSPNGRWRARWRAPDGTNRSKTFTMKRDAERFVARELVSLEQGKAGFSNSRGVLSDLIPEWWASAKPSVKPRTAERYDLARRMIEDRIGNMKLADLDYNAVQAFVNELSETYAPRTVSATYGVLGLIIADGVKRDRIRPIKPPTLPKIYKPRLTIPTVEEVERLAFAIDARLASAVILSGYCGLREGELLALHRRDVDLKDGTILVHSAINKSTGAIESTKTENVRRVYMPTRVITAVRDHLSEYNTDRLYPFTGSLVQKRWEAARRQLGLDAVRFHDLRHSAASQMIHAGWSVTQVAKQLGHADPAMTLRTYSHLWPDSQKEAIRKLDEYLAQDEAS